MTDAFKGFKYFLQGFELISKPGLKRYVIIPALINMAVFVGMFLLAKHYISDFNHWLLTHVPGWLAWLSIIIWILFIISFILFFVYAFVIIGNLVAAPFNGLLAEKVELYLTGNKLEQKGWYDFIKDLPRIMSRQFSIIGYYLFRAMLIMILFFIPGIQPIVPILWFAFNAWFITITYVDYPTDNHHIPIHTVRKSLNRKRGLALVFGSSILVASMVPVLNFFTIPAAVAGATSLWLTEFNKK